MKGDDLSDENKYEKLHVSDLKHIYGSHFSYSIDSESLISDKKIIEILGDQISKRHFTIEKLQEIFMNEEKSKIKILLEELDEYYHGNRVIFKLAEYKIGTKNIKDNYYRYLENKNDCLNQLKKLAEKSLKVDFLDGIKCVHANRLIPKQKIYIMNEDLNNLYIKEGIVSEVYTFDKKWISYDEDKKADIYFRYIIREAEGRDYIIEPENAIKYKGYFETNNYTRKIFISETDAHDYLDFIIDKGIVKLTQFKQDFFNYKNNFLEN